jgi:hypothetical protein
LLVSLGAGLTATRCPSNAILLLSSFAVRWKSSSPVASKLPPGTKHLHLPVVIRPIPRRLNNHGCVEVFEDNRRVVIHLVKIIGNQKDARSAQWVTRVNSNMRFKWAAASAPRQQMNRINLAKPCSLSFFVLIQRWRLRTDYLFARLYRWLCRSDCIDPDSGTQDSIALFLQDKDVERESGQLAKPVTAILCNQVARPGCSKKRRLSRYIIWIVEIAQSDANQAKALLWTQIYALAQ